MKGINSCSYNSICGTDACEENTAYFGSFQYAFDTKLKYILFGCHLDPMDEDAVAPYVQCDGSQANLPQDVSPLPACPMMEDITYPQQYNAVYKSIEGSSTVFTSASIGIQFDEQI